MKSLVHPQNTRPAPLNTAKTPTRLAAPAALIPVISMAAGAACEMSAIPAVTFRASIAVNTYH